MLSFGTKSAKSSLDRSFVPHGRLSDPVANMTNCEALIFNFLPQLNWAGFYLLKNGELVLGR